MKNPNWQSIKREKISIRLSNINKGLLTEDILSFFFIFHLSMASVKARLNIRDQKR